MYFAYVIKSINYDFFYKGHCENLEKRLVEHNSGKTRSIKHYAPFTLAYYEEYETRQEAIVRERYFKSAAGRRYLKKKLSL